MCPFSIFAKVASGQWSAPKSGTASNRGVIRKRERTSLKFQSWLAEVCAEGQVRGGCREGFLWFVLFQVFYLRGKTSWAGSSLADQCPKAGRKQQVLEFYRF